MHMTAISSKKMNENLRKFDERSEHKENRNEDEELMKQEKNCQCLSLSHTEFLTFSLKQQINMEAI
ncbi:hypothetical protein CHS0354_003501 [Potamilus streckersoni]|uniref:Uncharacterized protein n=1 Tax=Potamilus streckersoni TaxID=2493646 RepID=A0AAE0SYT8_9BIVA|nr:hypothetical protein CHS0354_003501 [Potamilus streckersoni]